MSASGISGVHGILDGFTESNEYLLCWVEFPLSFDFLIDSHPSIKGRVADVCGGTNPADANLPS